MNSATHSRLVRTLYRSLWRVSTRVENTQPAAASSILSGVVLPAGMGPNRADGVAPALRDVLRHNFRAHSRYPASSPDAKELLDQAFSALRVANLKIAALDAAATSSASASTSAPAVSPAAPAAPVVPLKPASVAYSVGQVIAHSRFGYRGVIVGWHATCRASKEWMARNAANRPDQPYYMVLVDVRDRADAQISYVAQENVRLLSNGAAAAAAASAASAGQALFADRTDIPFYHAGHTMVARASDFGGSNGGAAITTTGLTPSAVGTVTGGMTGGRADPLSRLVLHPLITKHFAQYRPEDGVYIPTPALAESYPHDLASSVALTAAAAAPSSRALAASAAEALRRQQLQMPANVRSTLASHDAAASESSSGSESEEDEEVVRVAAHRRGTPLSSASGSSSAGLSAADGESSDDDDDEAGGAHRAKPKGRPSIAGSA